METAHTELTIQEARILIVDDQEVNVQLLKRILRRAGYTRLTTTTDSRQVLPIFTSFQPDLILLDLTMPHVTGFEVMEQLRPLIPGEDYLPILVLTADVTAEIKRRALSVGAKDFLTKPLDTIEVLLRIDNLLKTRLLHLQLREQNQLLDEKVRERTLGLEEAQIEILERLAAAAEFRDDETGKHTLRVGQMSSMIAHALDLPAAEVELIRRAAPLHDVGKIGIPDSILLKQGRLTAEEFEVMKRHTTIGARMLANGRSDLTQMAECIALTHHERWDSTGYPGQLQGEEIPLVGRIVSVADVFDALTHERSYKAAWPVEEAVAEIERQSGRQFDPRVAEAFLSLHVQYEHGE
jgi:putative two-component system response regulator